MAANEQRPDTGASYRQSKREMFVMVGLWLVMGIWVLGYNSRAAYEKKSQLPETKECYYCREIDIKYHAIACKHCEKDPDGPDGDARRLKKMVEFVAANKNKFQLRTVFGMPHWVFFGWLCPLLVANIFTLWFCLRFMKDEPMEELPEDTP